MRISTDASIIGNLVSLYGPAYPNSAPTGAGITAAGFGPATLLSLGQGTPAGTAGFDYTHLARLAAQIQSPITPQISSKQREAEQATIKRATVLRLNGRYDDARSLLEAALAKNPRSGTAVHGLGAIELDLGNYEKAEHYFRKAHFLAPEYGFDRDATNAQILQHDDDYVLEQAERLSKRGETRADATRLLVALTRRSPSNAVARSLLAENLIRDGDAARGLAQYQIAISSADRSQLQEIESKLVSLVAVAPRATYLRNLLGQTELKLGKHEKAAETLGLATQLSGNDPLYQADEALAHVALGRDAIQRGNLSAAMSAFKTAQSLDPFGEEVKVGLAEGYTARALWLMRIGDPNRAIDELSSAKSQLGAIENDELKTRIADGFYRAGRTLESRRLSSGDKVGDEIAAFQAAYDLDPENLTYARKLAETHSIIGDEYLADGDNKNAAYAYQAAHEVAPTNDTYKTNAISAFLAWGDERSAAYDHHQAITAYQAAYDLDNDNETAKFSLADAFNTRGLFYKSLGEDFYEQAADDFLAALDLYPDNQEYQDNYDSVT
ncbi:MAG: tetratricopeptide repeat protein [Phycisphaerae bacterium]